MVINIDNENWKYLVKDANGKIILKTDDINKVVKEMLSGDCCSKTLIYN